MALLCHPYFTTTNLSYRFPIFETSATALCGTTGIHLLANLNGSTDVKQVSFASTQAAANIAQSPGLQSPSVATWCHLQPLVVNFQTHSKVWAMARLSRAGSPLQEAFHDFKSGCLLLELEDPVLRHVNNVCSTAVCLQPFYFQSHVPERKQPEWLLKNHENSNQKKQQLLFGRGPKMPLSKCSGVCHPRVYSSISQFDRLPPTIFWGCCSPVSFVPCLVQLHCRIPFSWSAKLTVGCRLEAIANQDSEY